MTFDVFFVDQISTLFDQHAPLHKLSIKKKNLLKQNRRFVSEFNF